MKKVICSFASSNFQESLVRLHKEIKKIDFFDQSYLYNENNLDSIFRSKFEKYLKEDVRGYGYWIWKPYLINSVLSTLNDGDSLLYIDAGCHINKKGKKRLTKYFNLLDHSKSGILAFQLSYDMVSYSFFGKKVIIKNYFLERKWTKGDLLDFFKIRNQKSITETPQILSGAIFIKKNSVSREFLSEWMDVLHNHLELIDDSNSITDNDEEFIEHRHDQSVFSILCKLYKVDLLPTTEIEAEPAVVNNYPILAIRDIGGRMPYKSFSYFRLTRMLKAPYLLFERFTNKLSQIINQ